jgi:hypothetical protein
MYAIGNILGFEYGGKTRLVRIEKVKMGDLFGHPKATLITGWDIPSNGYRSFTVAKIENPVLEGWVVARK